jgi:hemerythrin superfamily protein
MANLSKAAAKVTGAARGLGKALSGYPAIFRHLAGEHGEVATLMNRVAGSADDTEVRKELFPEIRRSLLAHAKAEEKEFYGRLRAFAPTAPMIPQALEEHRRIEEHLDRLNAQSCESDAWIETFQSLVSLVEAHVQREEDEMFPAAKDVLSSDEAKDIQKRYESTEEQEKARI